MDLTSCERIENMSVIFIMGLSGDIKRQKKKKNEKKN